jgi:hypothetical protein
MIDVMIGIMINGFKKIENMPENIIDYFLFIHSLKDKGYLPHNNMKL